MSKTILAVDDSRTMRDMVAHTLKGAGFEVVSAEDGEEALKLLEQTGKIDLIITDLNMPKVDGFGLIDGVRNSAAHRFVPILMLTTEAGQEQKERGKALGATGWIVKPFNPEKLVQVVNKVCA
ncbi:MAG: response regulator [Alphaproteobacteria bacterium]|nr:response regulator [Alphaproteobacteria bacterium]